MQNPKHVYSEINPIIFDGAQIQDFTFSHVGQRSWTYTFLFSAGICIAQLIPKPETQLPVERKLACISLP